MKILIIKPSSLGDIVHGLQVVNELKKQVSDVTIHWVIRDCFAEIVEKSGIVDKTLLFHRRGGLRKFIELIKEIRSERYDYVLDLQGLARSGILTFFAKADKKIGRKDARECAFLCYNDVVDFPQAKDPHAVEILLQFLKKFNLEAKIKKHLTFSIDESLINREILDISKKKYLCVFPYSRREEKEWPFFRELVDNLSVKVPDCEILILGDKPWGSSADNVIDLAKKTTITESIFLISHAKLVIANDSGPVHISAAVGVNVLGLYGPTDPKKYGPYAAKNSLTIRSKTSDMKEITVDEVLQAALTFF